VTIDSGHRKAAEEEGDPGTPGKEMDKEMWPVDFRRWTRQHMTKVDGWRQVVCIANIHWERHDISQNSLRNSTGAF